MRINRSDIDSRLELSIKIEKTDQAMFLEDQVNVELFQNKFSDAGYDVKACIKNPICLSKSGILMIPTGLKIQTESRDWEIEVRSRSGLAAKAGVFVLNSPGTIDYEYRDEIKVILANFGKKDYYVQPGERIAQLCFRPIPFVTINYVEEIDKTDRGGFGSSGKK